MTPPKPPLVALTSSDLACHNSKPTVLCTNARCQLLRQKSGRAVRATNDPLHKPQLPALSVAVPCAGISAGQDADTRCFNSCACACADQVWLRCAALLLPRAVLTECVGPCRPRRHGGYHGTIRWVHSAHCCLEQSVNRMCCHAHTQAPGMLQLPQVNRQCCSYSNAETAVRRGVSLCRRMLGVSVVPRMRPLC